MLVFSVGALLSVAYHPNHVHFAFVMPAWIVLAALLLESFLGVVERAVPGARLIAAGLAGLLLVGAGWQLWERLRFQRSVYSIPHETAFGRIDMTSSRDVGLFQWVMDVVDREQVKEAFFYPCSAGYYLMTGTRNPTRYQFVAKNYTDREQFEEIATTLEVRRTPLVVFGFCMGFNIDTRLKDYLRGRYEPIGPPRPQGSFPVMVVSRRRPDEPSAPAAYF